LLWVGRRGDLVDVAVRAGEVRPVTAIGLVNGTDEVDAGLFEFCARLPDVVDQKTGDRARDEVLVTLSPGPNNSTLSPLGSRKIAKSGSSWTG
jgi:hypothetical protein